MDIRSWRRRVKRNMFAQVALAVILALSVRLAWCSDKRVVIVHEETAVARQATDLLAEELRRLGLIGEAVARFGMPETDAGRIQQEGGTVIVAVGPKALRPALQFGSGRPVIAMLVSRATIDDLTPPPDRLAAVVLDQPVERILNLVQVALPGARQLGVLAGPASQRAIRPLDRRAQERQLSLQVEAVGASDDVVTALERLTHRMKVLLALPDPVVHNRNTVQPLLLTTYRAGIPVVGYSESYLQAGAVLALYSTPAQLAQQAAETAIQILEGRPVPAIQVPRYFMVGVNGAVSRSLGLSIPSITELQERLRVLE